MLKIIISRRIANVGNHLFTEAIKKIRPNRTKNSLSVRITGEVPTNNAFELLYIESSLESTHGISKGWIFNWYFHQALNLAAQVAGELDTIRRDMVGGCSSLLNRVSVARL